MPKMYYFGCVERPGHYMHTLDLRSGKEGYELTKSNPWGFKIDGLVLRHGSLHHKDGWTAFGRADNTVDHRPGSHSTFLAEGTFTEEEMIALACEHFPTIAKRIGLRSY